MRVAVRRSLLVVCGCVLGAGRSLLGVCVSVLGVGWSVLLVHPPLFFVFVGLFCV